MSKYIKIMKNRDNELRINADIRISSLGLTGISSINVKIDTGCPYTSIPIQKLGISQYNAQIMKQNDCLDTNIKKNISFGVNDTQKDRRTALSMFKAGNFMQLKQVTFIHRDLEMTIGNIKIHKQEVKISYDRTGNILIGMDILENWDIHIGKADNGETVFLACPIDQINESYLRELENTFHITSK